MPAHVPAPMTLPMPLPMPMPMPMPFFTFPHPPPSAQAFPRNPQRDTEGIGGVGGLGEHRLSPPTEDSLPAAGREGMDVEIKEQCNVQIRKSQVRLHLRGVHRGERVAGDPCPLRLLRPVRALRFTLLEGGEAPSTPTQSELEPAPAKPAGEMGKVHPAAHLTLSRTPCILSGCRAIARRGQTLWRARRPRVRWGPHLRP
jgi:hypothetical protein